MDKFRKESVADVIVYLIGSRVEIIWKYWWSWLMYCGILNKDSIMIGFLGSGNKYLYLYLLE